MKKLLTRSVWIMLLLVVAAMVFCAAAAMAFVQNAKEIDIVVHVVDHKTGSPVAQAKVILTVEYISEFDTNTPPHGFAAITNDQGLAMFRCKAPFMVSRRRMLCEAASPGKHGSARVVDGRCIIRIQELLVSASRPSRRYETFTGQFGYALPFEEGRVTGPAPSGSAR
jgi:hypothetical protein